MSSSISQLSTSFARLSSLERRFIIFVAVIIFAVINLLFVLPHFNDLAKIDVRFSDANSKLEKYEKEISQIPNYERNIKQLEGEGAAVPQEDQSVNFLTAIQNQAAQSGVGILANNRQPARTNQFFVELGQALTTQSGEAQLVDFLYSLGTGNSLIRARALSVRPDAQRTGLTATMTLIASYQKKAPARTPSSAKPPASAPSTTSAPKPASSTGVPVVQTNKTAGPAPATRTLTPTTK